MLIDPVRNQTADDVLAPPRLLRISRTHESEMFQSSIMSWSSKIIAVGTTEKNQRSTSGAHDSWYSQQYSSKSPTSGRQALDGRVLASFLDPLVRDG